MATATSNLALIEALDATLTAFMTQDALTKSKLVVDHDTYWVIFGACLVFLMQCGFAMLEVGSVSTKNTKNILMKNVLDACIGGLVWWMCGYGVAFGAPKDTGYGGQTGFALSDDGFDPENMYGEDGYSSGAGYSYASWFFQFAFAATTATIVSGAVAERISFLAYLVYSTLLTGFIYPVVVCWCWNAEGTFSAWTEDTDHLLFDCGVVDFAGSGVVHMTGGVAALVGAIIVGPRLGRFGANGEVKDLPQQNAVLQTLGLFILWFGWYGFNGVSTLYIANYSGVAAKVMTTTTIAAAAGGLTSTVVTKMTTGVVDLGAAINGILGGLVSITANCSVVEPYAALIIGIIGGFVYQGSAALLLKCKIDDIVGASPVHMFCGIWGVIAAGLFATPENYSNAYYSARADKCAGIFYGGDGSTLAANFCFILALICWVAATCTVMFGTLRMLGKLRLSDEDQQLGMDAIEHGGPAYPELAPSAVVTSTAVFKKVATSDVEVNPSGLPSN